MRSLPALFPESVPALLFSSLLACSGARGAVPPDREAIARVAAGTVATAKASWWGFDPGDATESLQAALDSAARTIVVEDMGSPWVVRPVALPGDKEIVFEKGVVVEAKRGEFLGASDCLLSAKDRSNLILRGDGAVLRMRKADYHRAPYAPAEWRHALSIRGCRNVRIEGLALNDSGGDGIYLGAGAGGATNRDIVIRRVVCDGNNRQGISVITAENLLIEDAVLKNTAGTAPEAGIDFEPNHAGEKLVACVMRNCRSENNRGHGYHLYLGHFDRDSAPVSIRFENCVSKANGRYSTYVGLANREGGPTVGGSVEYEACRFDADETAGVYVRGSEAGGGRVLFRKCEIVREDRRIETALAPITIELPRRLDVDLGVIRIEDTLVRDALARRPIGLSGSPLARIAGLEGDLRHRSPQGEAAFRLDAAQLAEWFPDQARATRIPPFAFDWRRAAPVSRSVAPCPEGLRLRRAATLLVWGEAGEACELRVEFGGLGSREPVSGSIRSLDASGIESRLQPGTEGRVSVFRFTPKRSGPLRLEWQGDSKETLEPVSCSAPMALLLEAAGLNLFRSPGRLFFAVPEGVARFAILVEGAGGAETVKAKVRDAAGSVVEEKDNIAAPHVFVVERKAPGAPEVWSVELERAGEGILEDVSIQCLGLPPLLSLSPPAKPEQAEQAE